MSYSDFMSQSPRRGAEHVGAKIVADSISRAGVRLTTFECVVPKWMIAEINTHGMIRRNSASSRAIPTLTLCERIEAQPFTPLEWRYRAIEGGMQAGELMSAEDAAASEEDWLEARDAMILYVEKLEKRKAAKEHINRLLEPWMYSIVVMTATEWENYFTLRGPSGGAQPEFKKLVEQQIALYEAQTELVRRTDALSYDNPHTWHLPYVTDTERAQIACRKLPLISAARVAGVSYYRPGARKTIDADVARGLQLQADRHLSPLEMPAFPQSYGVPIFYGPFFGWEPYRSLIGGESGSVRYGRQASAHWLREQGE